MLLAAGLGTRMRPLTEHTAKPLLSLAGRTLLDHALDRLEEAGVDLVVVNGFWHADRIETQLAARAAAGRGPPTVLRRETVLLDTGGGVRAALDLLGPEPFYVVNGDAFWLDGPRPVLPRLAAAFAAAAADDMLLLHRVSQVQAEVGDGDFALDQQGAPRRPTEHEIVPYVYAGVHVMTPALLDGTPEGPFSMNLAWDRAMAAGRLRAVVHDGQWFHLSTPADLSAAEAVLRHP